MLPALDRRLRRLELARQMAPDRARYVVLCRPPKDGEVIDDILADDENWRPLTDEEWLEQCAAAVRDGEAGTVA